MKFGDECFNFASNLCFNVGDVHDRRDDLVLDLWMIDCSVPRNTVCLIRSVDHLRPLVTYYVFGLTCGYNQNK